MYCVKQSIGSTEEIRTLSERQKELEDFINDVDRILEKDSSSSDLEIEEVPPLCFLPDVPVEYPEKSRVISTESVSLPFFIVFLN